MTVPTAELQKLELSEMVDLWILDCTNQGGETHHFHAYSNVIWQGVTYTAMPMEIDGLEERSSGSLPRPRLRVANVDGTISPILQAFDDLIGARVVRKRTLGKYLDAANFPGGNPTADPSMEWPQQVYYIEQKTLETRDVIEFQLVSALDLQGRKIPRRIIQATVCPWNNAAICQYSTGSQCAKSLAACKAKWGTAPLPFGGFPAAARIR